MTKTTAKPVRAVREPTEGARKFTSFLDKNAISKVAAAKAIGVSDPTVCEWASGMKRPKAHHREAIAIWTHDEVPVDAWRDQAELGAVEGVTPFQPPSETVISDADRTGEHDALKRDGTHGPAS